MQRPAGEFSSVVDSEVNRPQNIELRQFNPLQATERLVDCWPILQRSSVDTASLPPSERNIFAFTETCIYMATVHDADYSEKERARLAEEAKTKGKFQEPQEAKDVWADLNKKVQSRLSVPSGMSTVNQTVELDQDHNMDDLSGTGYQYASSSSADNTARTACAVPQQGAAFPVDCPSAYAAGTNEPSAARRCDDDVDFDIDRSTAADVYPPISPAVDQRDLIGIAYIAPASGAAPGANEVSVGLALLPHARGVGFGTATVRKLLELAFDVFGYHRVSAGVLGPNVSRSRQASLCRIRQRTTVTPANTTGSTGKGEGPKVPVTPAETESILRMFVAVGFYLEGKRRRAVRDLDDNGAWRDAYYLAMLDTDWIHPRTGRTRWDEMFIRQQSEREALADAESRLKRSASVETLRPGNSAMITIGDTSSVASTSAPSVRESSATQEQQIHVQPHYSPSSSISVPASNPFRDPAPIEGSRASRIFFTSNNDAESDAEGSAMDYSEIKHDASHFSSKVVSFLRAHPAPGPPPSEDGSSLDSEVGTNFESCADPDEVELLAGAKGKGKAKSTDEEQVPLLSAGDGAQAARPNILTDSPITRMALGSGLEMDQQSRKKRRRSTVAETDFTSAVLSNSSSVDSPPGMAERKGEVTSFPSLRNDTDNHVEMDSEMSDAETESTTDSTSTWDVVPSDAGSPSPSYSLFSSTGSLSLQSVSEGEY